MESLNLNIDLEIWKREVLKLQRQYNIYPGIEPSKITYLRVAILLSDLFCKMTKGVFDLRKDFYLLANEYGLDCKKLSPKKESEVKFLANSGETYLWVSNPQYSNFIKSTRIALYLTPKTIDELPNGFDPEIVVGFLQFLFRFCDSGFLFLRKYNTPYDTACQLEGPFFIDRKNDFRDVPGFILKHYLSYRYFPKAYPYFIFNHSLVNSPKNFYPHKLSALYARINTIPPDLEQRFDRFGIWPSIRVFVKPNRHCFFWILKDPANASHTPSVINFQLRIAKLLNGDMGRCGDSINTNLPGQFIITLWPLHLVSYETTEYVYNLDFFNSLPRLTPVEIYFAYKTMLSSTFNLFKSHGKEPPQIDFPLSLDSKGNLLITK